MKTLFSQSYLLLFTQLLVFFFVSSLTITSSNAYANDITLNQFKNFVVNVGIHQGMNESNVITYIDSSSGFSSFVDATTNVFENSNIDLYFLNTGYNIWFYYFNHNTTNKIVVRNKNDVDITISGSFTGYQLQLNDSTIFRTTTSTTYNVTKNGYYYSDLIMYDGWGSTIWKSAPVYWTSSDIFDGPYQASLGLYFLSKLSDSNVDVWSFEDIPLYKFSGDEDFYFGQLFYPLGSNVYETNSNFFFRWGDWQFRTLPDSATYLEYVGSDDKGSLYDVYLDKNYLYDNTIYSLVWTDTTTDPYTLAYANFYLGDKNTVIIDGVIDPSKTFSGDYDDKYNYENDPNQNFWKDTYNRFMTPSGEVLRGTITSLMSDLDISTSGEESGELMMALVGLDVISNDFGDFIISWDDFSPNLTIKGQLVSSSGPFIPAGQINFSQMERNNETFHDIMQYTRAILSFSVITLFFGNLWHTLLITLGISTQIYEKNEQAKEKLSRQAERDQRRQEREDRQRYQQWLYEHRR